MAIDSRDRDVAQYPLPNKYRVYLSEKYVNVKSVSLVTTEIPNTQQLILSRPAYRKNNRIYWRQAPDQLDHDEIYSVSIAPGNYNNTTLITEMHQKMNSVQRRFPTPSISPVFHNFAVSVDPVSNIVSFSQTQVNALSNPIMTTLGSDVVTVNSPSNNLQPGAIVTIAGASGVGGISAAAINTQQIISVDVVAIDNFYRDVANANSVITYDTITGVLTGRLNITRGGNRIYGHGTRFVTELSEGRVVHIGYNNYTVQSIIDDTTCTIEETFQESFDRHTEIVNLSPTSSVGIEALSPTSSTVNVISHKLRNINYANSLELSEDSAYQSAFQDLALSVYSKLHAYVTITDQTRSFKIISKFQSREPTYKSFSSFTIGTNPQNFNMVVWSSSNNQLSIIDATTQVTRILPTGVFNVLQTVSCLSSVLTDWQVAFDTVESLFYLTPPLSGDVRRIILPNISGNYATYKSSSIDFSGMASAGSSLGFEPALYSGNACIAQSAITDGVGITLSPEFCRFAIIDVNTSVVYYVVFPQTVFAGVEALVTYLNSVLISLAVPVTVTYKSGLQKVIFQPISSQLTFQVVFVQTRSAGNVSDVLGFTCTDLHQSVTILSAVSVSNYLRVGSFSHQMSDVVNAVQGGLSRKIRGVATIDNNTVTLQGNSDVFYFSVLGNSVSSTTGANTATGNISRIVWTVTTLPVTATTGQVAVSASSNSDYRSSNFLANNKACEVFKVTFADSTFSLQRRSDGEEFGLSRSLTIERGRTYIFDLRALPDNHRFKLSSSNNGPWNIVAGASGNELLQDQRYFFDGAFLQVCIPDAIHNNTRVLL